MTIPSIINGVAGRTEAKTLYRSKLEALKKNEANISQIDIIDIRHDMVEFNLKADILKSLKPEVGQKKLPTLLLYDERGLQLFEEITYLEEYYLTNAEINVLQTSSDNIAKAIPSGSMVVELGSGNLRKVSILLHALEAASKDVDYYALDLSSKELKRTLEQVPKFKHVRCHGLLGTYEDGLDWLKSPENRNRSKCVMSLGSSIGNFNRHDAAEFLRGFSDALETGDSMLIGLDATNDPAKVYHAYNDHVGITHKFILNGLLHANNILGEPVFELDDWEVIGEYVFDKEGGRHQAFYTPLQDIRYRDIQFKAGERIQVEQSLKFSAEEAAQLWQKSGLNEVGRWSASSEAYNESESAKDRDRMTHLYADYVGVPMAGRWAVWGAMHGPAACLLMPSNKNKAEDHNIACLSGVHLLTKHNMAFDSDPALYAATPVPTLYDWKGLWETWDTVTRRMIPDEELLEKPIKLRNACIFYLGHIPTFMDIQLTKSTKLPPCEPSYYPRIFERGIDPDVDNPEHCHAHSEIPDEWPPLQEILSYQDKVRSKIEKLTKAQDIPRHIGRALWIGFEHEIMHLETLLYMLLQSDKTLPPTKFTPDFEGDAKLAKSLRVPNEWIEVPEQKIIIGLDDPEDNSGPDHHFGWDNEKPPRTIVVPSFAAKARPITNEEYARYLEQTQSSNFPASWTQHHSNGAHTNGYSNGRTNGYTNGQSGCCSPVTKAFLEGKAVRTVYGPVPLKYALDWPVFASYDELAGCASWMGGRIPTLEEARSIYSHADGLKAKDAEQHLGKTVPAVNAHLINDGVEESPPSQAWEYGEGSTGLFTNLAGANVGFKDWHPVAVTANGNKLAGQAEMGGVWEWTSSTLEKHEGFEPMKLYPAYTADFFDGKHNIVLGGSWATHPRIAGRKTFVNWYQRNYPYAWAGARLVRDL